MSVWEPKGRDGLPHITSGMCPVTTEWFNDAVLLALGGCGCLSVSAAGEAARQPAGGRPARHLGSAAGARQWGAARSCRPAARRWCRAAARSAWVFVSLHKYAH